MRLSIFAAVMMLTTGSALADDYPMRPITLVVPYAAGGPTDTIARITAASMSKALKQQVIIENAVGAGGTIGAARVARAEPDGYTLLIHHVGLSTAATLYRKLPYDTKTAFVPLGLVTEAPQTIIARSDFAPNTLKELIEHIKANGMKVTYAHAGLGAASQLCGMLLQTAIQTQMTTVPYKGNGPIMNDLIGKQVDMTCDQATNTTGPILGKQVKAYAVTTPTRVSTFPDLPTAGEAGLPGFQISVWHGVYAPKGTPAGVVKVLSDSIVAAMKDPELGKRFADITTDPVAPARATPEVHEKMLLAEIDRWAPIIKAAGQFAD